MVLFTQKLGWDSDWTYHFRLGEYKFIEWCEMVPRQIEGGVELTQLLEISKKLGLSIKL